MKHIRALELMKLQSTTPKTGEVLHDSTAKFIVTHPNDINAPVKEVPEQPQAHHEKSGRLVKEEAAHVFPKQEALLTPNQSQDNTTKSPRGTQPAVQHQQTVNAQYAHLFSERERTRVKLEGLQIAYMNKHPVDINYWNQLKDYMQQCEAKLK